MTTFYCKLECPQRGPIETGQTVIDEIDANNVLTARNQTVDKIKIDPDYTTIYGHWKNRLVMAFAKETTWYVYPPKALPTGMDVHTFLAWI